MSKIFDVAMWSTDDIVGLLPNKYKNDKEFITAVIEDLRDTFDAGVGVNWDTIEYSIHRVREDYEKN